MTGTHVRQSVRRAAVMGLALAFVATIVAAAQPPAPHDRSWVDSPLTGSELPLATIEVVGHATAAGGVSRVELAANGEPAGSVDLRDAPVLATVRLDWTPRAAGVFLLVLRARDPAGAWGAPASVIVVVGDGGTGSAGPSPSVAPPGSPVPSTAPVAPTPTPTTAAPPTAKPTSRSTPRPPATPRPTRTPRPTPTPCPTPDPALTSPPDRTVISDAADNPPVLRWAFRSAACPVESFRVQVSYDREFRDLVVDQSVAGDRFEFARRLGYDDCETVYWRIRPTWSTGVGAWSDLSRVLIAIGRC